MLSIKNLTSTFDMGNGQTLTAVDGLNMDIPSGKIVGLVGESGSGKSVSSLSVMRLLPSSATSQGQVIWKEQNLLGLSEKEMRPIRGSEIGLIFQNPLAALNPVFTIGNQLIETIMIHQKKPKKVAKTEALKLLSRVQIPDPEARFNQYPHEFSLGMCQRVMIALTLAMTPDLLMADEPTASLDVTVQAQIMALIQDIQKERGMSVLLISHDLGIISQNCDYIYIMYLGQIVEEGPPQTIFHSPQHPYTQALIGAIPNPDPNIKTTHTPLKGDIPSPLNIPKGCRFHTRCPHVMDKCRSEVPDLLNKEFGKAACFLT